MSAAAVPEPPVVHDPALRAVPDAPVGATRAKLADLQARTLAAAHAGSVAAVARQHGKGKLTARERIELLVDPGSFRELDALARSRTGSGARGRPFGDGVVTGTATVDGRQICVFSHDFTVLGGSLGEAFGQKVLKVMDLAATIGCPIVGINDSGGARIHEGVAALAFYAEIGRRNVRLSGVVPQISLVLGPCAGGAVYSPALTDFTVMVDSTSYMFVTGPDVVAAVTGEVVGFDDLGGPDLHAAVTGSAHYVAADEADAFDWTRTLLGFLPSNNLEPAVAYPGLTDLELRPQDLALDDLVPDAAAVAYDMTRIATVLADDGELLEVGARFAPNMLCAFARIDGRSVGLVANQPGCAAGAIDSDAAEKAARFVRFCDAFSLPLVTLVDVPGYLPGVTQERGGIIRRGAKLLYAYAEATVPMVTVVVRKAYGGGYATMGSKHLGADVNLAWPTAEISVMGGQGAVSVLHRAELEQATRDGRLAQVRAGLVDAYQRGVATPYAAAERGYVDVVIAPATTRSHVVRALRLLRGKSVVLPPKKHGNIPL